MAAVMKNRVPIILATLHAALTISVFALAIINPERSGLLPIMVFAVDFSRIDIDDPGP